ncbi:MAG TPA: type II secretion system F family protein [Candidatus Hydromicrobium sp.]
MNLISFKIGRSLINKHWFEIKKENRELLKLLEFENKISLTPDSFMGYKVILFVLFMTAGSLIGNSPINSGILGITAGAAGYFIPNLLLRNFRNIRKKEIDRDLPYVIDLLVVATLSGQNIYNAIKIVIEKYKGSICTELSNFIKDIDIGIGKIQAYRDLMDRSVSGNFKSFIFLLIQAEKYGSSINEILKQKSIHIKFEAYQDLERKIRRITILTLFPLVFLILPSFIILVGGPLIFSIGGNFLLF